MVTSAAPPAQSPLDRKILEHFPGLVVRKDLTTELKQNAVVPTYVLEYLLGQHCATDDPALISEGLESVRRILAKHYVHRNQAELIKSTIKDKGSHKVIDKITVTFNDKGGFYEVEFTNLGLKKVPIDVDFIKRYPQVAGWRDLGDHRCGVRAPRRPQGQPLADRRHQADPGGRHRPRRVPQSPGPVQH